MQTNGTARLTVTDATTTVSNNFVVAGNLTVQGGTTTVDSTTINITSSFIFEGPVDAHETTFSCGTPTQDNEVFLPQFSGSTGGAQYHMAVLADATTHASAQVTAAEFALLDGGSSIGTTAVATGDGFLHNDNGTMRVTQIDKIIDASAGDGLSASGVELTLDINGLANTRTAVAQADLIAISHNAGGGATKKIAFTHFEDQIFGNVSGDIAIAAGGAATIQENVPKDSMLNTDVISAQTDLPSGLASTDELLVSDAGTLKKMDVSVLATFIGDNASATVQTLTGATETLSVTAGPLVLANRGSAMTITLDSPANHQGKRVVIKKIGAGNVTISANGSEDIDGQSGDIVLESPMAAVTIISDGSDYFIV